MTIVDSLKAKGSTGGNNIAEAIKNLPTGGDMFIVNGVYDTETEFVTLDKTWQEVYDACMSGKKVYVKQYTPEVLEQHTPSYTHIADVTDLEMNIYENPTEEYVNRYSLHAAAIEYVCSSSDDYPVYDAS